MNIFWDKFVVCSALKGKNHRKSCISPKRAGFVVLESRQSEVKYRMWPCLSWSPVPATSRWHHHRLSLTLTDSLLIFWPHLSILAIHAAMNHLLPWTALNKSLPPFPILIQNLSPGLESICFTDAEKDDHLGEKEVSFVLLLSFVLLGPQCCTEQA